VTLSTRHMRPLDVRSGVIFQKKEQAWNKTQKSDNRDPVLLKWRRVISLLDYQHSRKQCLRFCRTMGEKLGLDKETMLR
jgi:hypothetical protein